MITNNNESLEEIAKILDNTKEWLFAIIGVLTVVIVVIQAFKYQGGDASEKQEAVRRIRNVIIYGAGVFALAWFAEYVVGKFAGV